MALAILPQPNALASRLKMLSLASCMQLCYPFLVVGFGSADIALLVQNRLLLTTGVYKFPYPVTTTFVQILITTLIIVGVSLICSLIPWEIIQSLFQSPDSDEKERLWSESDAAASDRKPPRRKPTIQLGVPKGVYEPRARWRDAWEVSPLAAVFLLKVVFENVNIATQPPTYILMRISVVPFSLLLSPIVARTSNSALPLWSAFLGCLSLFLATIPSTRQVNLGNMVVGLLSAFFVALLPLLLFRTYNVMCNSFAVRRRIAIELDPESANTTDAFQIREGLRIMCLTLGLTAKVSVALGFLLLLLSGELPDILKNCYVLDTKTLWLLVVGSGALTGTIFILTLLISIVASPVIPTFLFLPVGGLQVGMLSHFNLSLSGWLDLVVCWLSSLYFMLEKLWKEGTSTKTTNPSQRVYVVMRNMILPAVLYLGVHYIAHLSQTGLSTGRTELPSLVASKHAAPSGHDVFWFNGTESRMMIKDDFLGARPHVDTMADLSLLVTQCHEIDGGKGVDDVVHCLSYLQSEDYLSLPAAGDGMRASEQDPRKANFANADGHGNTLSRYISPSVALAASESSIGTCPGPVIPFHVYWTGSASWRVELFIKAYLYTQNMPCSRLWLWLDCDLDSACVEHMTEDPLFQRFRPLVERGDIVLKAWRFPSQVPLPKGSKFTEDQDSGIKEGLKRVIAKGIVQDANGQQWLMLSPTHIAFSPVVVSDAVRFIVLHEHGGLYCDMDILLMRDMRPMLLPDPISGPRAFAEQWVERAHPADYNTAVISLPANSSLSTYLLQGGLRMGLNFHPKAIGLMMWRDGRNGELAMLQDAVFDPLVTNLRREGTDTCTVPCHKNFESVFMSEVDDAPLEWSSYQGKQLPQAGADARDQNVGHEGDWAPPTNRSMENFFRGAWAYHIHNQWWKTAEPLSWMDVIMRAQDGFFDGQRTNVYGERWQGPPLHGYDIINTGRK